MSKKVILSIVSLVALAAAVGYGVYYFQHRSLVSSMESLFREGDYPAIVEALQPQIDPDTVAPDLRLLLGKALYRMGRLSEAQETLDPLLRFGQERPEAIEIAGWIWLKTGGYLQAKDTFEKLDRPEYHMDVARDAGLGAVALIRSERYRRADLDEARSLLQQAVSSDHPPTEAYLYLAEYELIQHNYDQATDIAQKAVNQDPFWSEPHVILGRCFLQTKAFSKAQKSFERALDYGASEVETNYYLARSLYLQGDLARALAVFEDLAKGEGAIALKAGEDAAKVYIVLGNGGKAKALLEQTVRKELSPSAGMQLYQLYMKNGEKEKAFSLLQEIISNWPLSADAQLEMGNQLLRQGNTKRAYSAYQNVLDDDAQNHRANYNLGCISVMLGQMFQAPDYFDLSSRFYDGFFEGKVNYALSLLAVGREMEGRQILQDISIEVADNPMVLQAQALERFLAGYPEVSLKRIAQSVEQKPDRSVPFIIRGEILMRLFQFENAKQSFREALSRDPQNLRALLGLAHVSYRLGEYDESKTIYNDLYNLISDLHSGMVAEIMNGKALLTAKDGDYVGAMDLWDKLKLQSEFGQQLALVNRAVASGNAPNAMTLNDLADGLVVNNPLPELLFNYALLTERFTDPVQAADRYQKLVDRYPSFLPGLFNLAENNFRRYRILQAIDAYTRASKAAPEQVDIMNNLAAAYSGNNELQTADEWLDKAQELEPLESLVAFNRTLVAMKQNDNELAAKRFKDASQRQVLGGRKSFLQGMLEASSGDWAHCVETAARPVAIGTLEPYRLMNYGIGLAKLGRLEEAETALLAARDLARDNADCHRELGYLYCRLGLYRDALDSLQASLRLHPDQDDVKQIIGRIQSWLQT